MVMNRSEDLILSCKTVHWYEPVEDVLNTPHLYLQHVMCYGNEKHVSIAEKYYSKNDFIDAIENVGPGKFTQERWDSWRYRLGLKPKRAPRRYEDDNRPLDWWRGMEIPE